MTEDGLLGSRYSGNLLKLEGDRVFVEFDEFFEDEAGLKHLKEWHARAQIRPPPPTTPVDFFRCVVCILSYAPFRGYSRTKCVTCFRLLRSGAQLEILFDDGWWDAELLKKRRVDGEHELLLKSLVRMAYGWCD